MFARPNSGGRMAGSPRWLPYLSALCSKDCIIPAVRSLCSPAVQFAATGKSPPPEDRRRDGSSLRQKGSFSGDTPFRPFSSLLQQGIVADQGTELFRAIIAANKSGQALETCSVPTCQDDAPAFPRRDGRPPVARDGQHWYHSRLSPRDEGLPWASSKVFCDNLSHHARLC